MTLAKVVERVLELGNPKGSLLQECFASVMVASVRLKEVQDERVNEEDNDGESVRLGCLEKIDEVRLVSSLIERYGNVLVLQGQASEIISTFLTSFPQCAFFFR